MSEITVEVTQSDITANVTSPNVTATVTSADISADITTTDVTANVQAANVTVNITGGTNSRHTIEDEGVDMADRQNLNFVGAGVTVTDDSANNRTIVTISGGGGGGSAEWGDISGMLSDQTDLQTALDGKVDENAAITGATKTKITYDAKGLVTAGDDAAISDISGLQSALDGKAATSHTHTLSNITQSGATLNQVPKWNGSAWVPADDETGGGGSVEIIDITYDDMATAIGDAALTPVFYRIIDAGGTDLGFICQAIRENEITVSGTGGYLNADFQGEGNYSGVAAQTGISAGAQLGIWRPSFEALTIPYTNLSGGTFAVGDTITGANTGATAVILTDDGSSEMTAYMTSAGVAFDGSEQLDNGNGVTADMDGAATGPEIQEGDIVIWNMRHWQLTNAANTDGTGPGDNVNAYEELPKEWENVGYITAWDISEFDFSENQIKYRQDIKGNKNRGVQAFQWGNDNCYSNIIEVDASIECVNQIGIIFNNTLEAGGAIRGSVVLSDTASISECYVSSAAEIQNLNLVGYGTSLNSTRLYNGAQIDNVTLSGVGNIYQCILNPGASISNILLGDNVLFENNILENGATITGITAGANCEISRNKVGQGGTLGGDTVLGNGVAIIDNVIGSSASIEENTLSDNCQMQSNLLQSGARIAENELSGSGSYISSNVIGVDASIVNNTIEGNDAFIQGNILLGSDANISSNTLAQEARISGNTLEQGATLSGTLEDGVQVNGNTILNGIEVSGKTFAAGVEFSGNTIGVDMTETETIEENITSKRAIPGFSDIPATINITGLTALDITAAKAQYCGIINVTSDNATESIDTITNPPTLFPFTIRPAAGLVLTITGTAYSGIGAGQIALKATDYTLDGDKGEYIVLEIDPLGTGCLVEKLVVNGLI